MGDLKDSSTLQWLQLMQTDSSYTKQLLADTLGRAGHGALCRMPKWIFNSLLAFAPSLFPILVLSAPDGGCWRLALYICMSFRNCRLYTLEERNSGEVASWWQSSFLEKKKKNLHRDRCTSGKSYLCKQEYSVHMISAATENCLQKSCYLKLSDKRPAVCLSHWGTIWQSA